MQRSFAAARATAPSILFIDEIASVGSRWSRDAHAENYRRQGINAFLAEIDGTRARLFAGCGIVADSDPDAELAEARAKFRPMQYALHG